MTKKWILDVTPISVEREEGLVWDTCISLGAAGITGYDVELNITIPNEDMPRFIEQLQADVLQMRASYETENQEEEDAEQAG